MGVGCVVMVVVVGVGLHRLVQISVAKWTEETFMIT